MQFRELLTKEYSISDLAALFKTEQFLKRDRLRFTVVSSGIRLLPGERQVLLLPLRTLAVFPFSFPFGKKVSVRNALELRFRPLLGSKESSLSLVSQVTQQKSNATSGVAWFVSKSETEQFEERFKDAVLWPAPYLFASRVNGNGAAVCVYEEGSCGMLFAGGEPKLYRWLSKDAGSAEQLADELLAYGKEISPMTDFSVFVTEPEKESALQRIGDATLELCKSAYSLNLSSVNMSAKAETDKFVDKIEHYSKLLTLFGGIFFMLAFLLLCVNFAWRGSFTKAPAQLYETVLHEHSENPMASALQKLRAVNADSTEQEGFEEHFKRIAAVWQEMPSHPVLDEMRYSGGGIQICGTAAQASDVDNFRKALSDAGYEAVTENAQQLQKIGMRFTISLTEKKR